jgi:hypothetical protein
MEMQGAKPRGNVCVDHVFDGVGVNPLVTVRTLPASSRADAHPRHTRTIFDKGCGRRSRNPARCIHVIPQDRVDAAATLAEVPG